MLEELQEVGLRWMGTVKFRNRASRQALLLLLLLMLCLASVNPHCSQRSRGGLLSRNLIL